VRIKLLLVLHICLLLNACGVGKGDDLDKFMLEAGNDIRSKVEPLPEVKPYVPLQYNADGTLTDPFKARKAEVTKTGGLQPNMARPKEPLEAYPLSSLKFVGSLAKEKLKYALIRTPDAGIQQVKIGNYIGQNFGMVTEISDSEVIVKEIVQDELTGDWVEHSASVSLQE